MHSACKGLKCTITIRTVNINGSWVALQLEWSTLESYSVQLLDGGRKLRRMPTDNGVCDEMKQYMSEWEPYVENTLFTRYEMKNNPRDKHVISVSSFI